MRKLSLKKHQIIFNMIFKDVNGFSLSKTARKQNDAPEYTYGEITFIPFIALLSQTKIDENTIFYDLGSGVGKAVIACSMVLPIKKSYGIELFTNLHSCALHQQIKLNKYPEYKHKADKIHFINDNFLNIDFKDATLIFINATAFIGETWDKLNAKFEVLKTPITIITTSKKISAKNFAIVKTTYVEMSWGIVVAYIQKNFK